LVTFPAIVVAALSLLGVRRYSKGTF
jgi:hypothetical protein